MVQRIIFTDMIQTVEPENLKTMLAVNFKDYGLGDRRKTAFIPFLGRGIFTTDGAAWQHSREMLRPNFTRSQVGDLTTFETHVSQLINNLPRNGATVDLQELFFQLTMDSATEFLFGESTNCLGSSASSPNMKFPECWNRGQEAIAERSRSGKLGQLLNNRAQFQKDTQFIHEFTDKFVRKGLELRKNMDVEKVGEEGRYIFLHELVKQTSDPVQIRSELLNILLAGRDTTASLLSNVWFILARRPDIWQKLRTEVDALGGEQPSYQQIKDMKYLRAVLNESKHYPLPFPRSIHLNIITQHSVSTPSSPATLALPSSTPSSPSAEAQMVNPQSSFLRAKSSNTPSTLCIAERSFTVRMQRSLNPRGGRRLGLDGYVVTKSKSIGSRVY